MSNAKKYPHLDKVWKVICGEYGIDYHCVPMPDLPKRSDKELEIAEWHCQILTMGQLTKWLNSESFSCASALLDAMNDMWHEADNV